MRVLTLISLLFCSMSLAAQVYTDEAADNLISTYSALKDHAKSTEEYSKAAFYKEKIEQVEGLKKKNAQLQDAINQENFQIAAELKNALETGWNEHKELNFYTDNELNNQPSEELLQNSENLREKNSKPSSQGLEHASDTAGTYSIRRVEITYIGLSTLNFGENTILPYGAQFYWHLPFKYNDMQGQYINEHGPILGFGVSQSLSFSEINGIYTNLHINGGYAAHIDSWSFSSELLVNAINVYSIWGSVAGIDVSENGFNAFTSAFLRLGTSYRFGFNDRIKSQNFKKYGKKKDKIGLNSFIVLLDVPFGGNPALSIGLSSFIFK